MTDKLKPGRALIGYGLLAALLTTTSALAQDKVTCGPEVKAEVAKLLASDTSQQEPTSKAALALQAQIYEKYQYCAADGENLSEFELSAISPQYCGKLRYLGSTFYERMPCCGYDPQKRQFACPVEIRQPFGFGTPQFPGSFEYVLSCVDLGAGFVPAALDRVHLADAVSGGPNWYFAVIANARGRLAQAQLTSKTLVARSILSWGMSPTSCSYTPIWGNVIDYQIRLDP